MSFIKKVKNTSGAEGIWCGKMLADNEVYTIPMGMWEEWASSSQVLSDIASENLIIGNDAIFFDSSLGENWLVRSAPFPFVTISLKRAGTVCLGSNEEWLSFSENMSNVGIISPKKVILSTLSWANSISDISFDLKFYDNGTEETDVIYTYSVRNSSNTYGYVTNLFVMIDVGNYIRVKYVDQGTNAIDLCLVAYIAVVD